MGVNLRNEVIRVLDGYPWACMFHDDVLKISVSKYWFKDVVEDLRKPAGRGLIDVKLTAPTDPAMGKGQGRFVIVKADSVLRISDRYKANDPGWDSLIVHEAVHALQDFHKRPFTRPQHEYGTYVAQRLYYRFRVRKAAGDPKRKVPLAAAGSIIGEADRIAERFEGVNPDDRYLTAGLAQPLHAALTAAGSIYADTAGQTAKGDGWK